MIRSAAVCLLLLSAPVVLRGQSAAETAQARQLAAQGRRGEAMRILQERLTAHPEDVDARALYGALLVLQREFNAARRELQTVLEQQPSNLEAQIALVNAELRSGHPSRAEHLASDALAAHPGNVDLMLARAVALRTLNRNPEALAQIEQAAHRAPDRDDVLRVRRRLRQELEGSELSLTGNYDRWNDHREGWREAQLAVQRNTTFGPGIARLSRGSGLGTNSNLFELEAFPRLRSTSAYLGAGYSGDQRLYPHWRFAGELFQGFPAGLEGSIGYRRLHFANTINLYTGSAVFYHHDWMFSARIIHEAGGPSGNAPQFAVRKYFSDGRQYVGLRFGKGVTRDEIRSSADLDSLQTREVAAVGNFVVRERWVVNVRAGAGREEIPGGRRQVRRTAGSLGLGYRF